MSKSRPKVLLKKQAQHNESGLWWLSKQLLGFVSMVNFQNMKDPIFIYNHLKKKIENGVCLIIVFFHTIGSSGYV